MQSHILLLVRAVVLGAASFWMAWGASATPLPKAGLEAAERWFVQQGTNIDLFREMPLEIASKRLTSAVYAFCKSWRGRYPTLLFEECTAAMSAARAPTDLNLLFEKCTAACGGISYVLRGLLEALGAETRYANFHNIPNQGNHTGVEVRIANRWAFFDPTFGVYFTDDGTAEGTVLSIRDVVREIPLGDLGAHVLQSGEEIRDFASLGLADLFDAEFKHPYMELINYQIAEDIETGEKGTLLSLDIPLDIVDGKAAFGWNGTPGSLANMRCAWLAATNDTLIDDDPGNDVSYNSSIIYNQNDHTRMTTLSVFGLKEEKRYGIELLLYGTGTDNRIQIGGAGKSILFPTGTVLELDGPAVHKFDFSSSRSSARIEIINKGDQGVAYLLGVSLTELSSP